MTKKRLAIVSTHPIQYQAPWFRALASHPEIDLEVLFCHKATAREQAESGFGVEFDWDVSLLAGYRYKFLRNVAAQPTVASFAGLDTPEVREVIERERYDAVMVNGWHYRSAWQTVRACWQTRTPVMARSDSHLHTERPLVKRVAKWPFYRWFISRLDACLPVGTWSRDYFLHYGARPERIFIVPHAVDTDYFVQQSARLLPIREQLRSQWQLGNETTVFLFAGKFTENKRPLHFARAVNQAARMGVPISGLMVGDGPLRRECEGFARDTSAPISFTGFLNQSQIAGAYVAADALVLPSREETWGMAVTEAMICGRGCLVSDRVGCAPDLIVPGETGAVFGMPDLKNLVELMVRYAKTPGLLVAMGQRVRETIGKCSVEKAVEGLVQAATAIRSKRS